MRTARASAWRPASARQTARSGPPIAAKSAAAPRTRPPPRSMSIAGRSLRPPEPRRDADLDQTEDENHEREQPADGCRGAEVAGVECPTIQVADDRHATVLHAVRRGRDR